MSAKLTNGQELLALAGRKFGELTLAERKLFAAAANGEIADYSAQAEEDNDPGKAAEWGQERVLKADRIAWVCADGEASALVTHAGIGINGARVDGVLELPFMDIPFPLYFGKCALPEGINLQYTRIPALNLCRTHVGPVHADGIKVERALFLRDGLKVDGGVRLAGAEVGGQLNFADAEFVNPGAEAIMASGVRVGGDLLLCGRFRAQGEVTLIGANINGQLNCEGGEFLNPGAIAIKGDSVKVGTDIFLRDGFRAQGEVRLPGASIGGQLSSTSAQFDNDGAVALNADGMQVRGAVFLRDGFAAHGEVRLVGAAIGGQLSCSRAQFVNPRRPALNAYSLRLDGDVFLSDGFKAHGETNLLGARIAGNVHCEGGRFVNRGGYAINADGLRVGGAVLLRDIAEIAGVVSLVGAIVSGYLAWVKVSSPVATVLDVSSARVGTLLDDRGSWPPRGRLLLDGLVYDQVHENSPTDAPTRIDWLRRQPPEPFRPQPYEQLATALRKSGHEDDAKRILIAKNQDRAHLTKLTPSEWWWYRVFGPMIGYGYRAWLVLLLMLVFILTGGVVFAFGSRAGVMSPTQEWPSVTDGGNAMRASSEDYPTLSPLAYSVDLFVPLVDLHQGRYWLPNANLRGQLHITERFVLHVSGAALRVYLWIHIASGWILTTLLVVGLTGLVHR